MKNRVIGLMIFMILLAIGFHYMNQSSVHIQSQSGLVMNAQTGEIVYEKDAKNPYPVASMSKLMTEFLVLDKISSGEITWDDHVYISESANSIGSDAVSVAISTGELVTVRDLFHAMVITSANNATIALAEYVAGTEEEFTVLMNEKAKELKLSKGTEFVNATGLPEGSDNRENTMSARDVAKLANHLIQTYPKEVLTLASREFDSIHSNQIHLVNTNKMLHSDLPHLAFEGMDGLKTGFTNAAGYSFVGTASRNGERLITVIMNAVDDEARFIDTKELLSFGFSDEGKQKFRILFHIKERFKNLVEQ